MIEITKVRARRIYRFAIYGFAVYGLFHSPFCASKAHGAELDELMPSKQVVMPQMLQYDQKSDLEKVIDSYGMK